MYRFQELNYVLRVLFPIDEQIVSVIYSLWLFFISRSVFILKVFD